MTRGILAGPLLSLILLGLVPLASSQPYGDATFQIDVISPTNSTYHSPNVPLDWSSNGEISWMAYTIDGSGQIPLAGNTTMTGLSNGSHVLTITANDTSGSTATCDIAFFVLDQSPPTIAHDRLYEAYEGSSITIGADIFDDFVVEEASVYYRFPGNDSYAKYPMTFCNSCGGVYKATIPASLIEADTLYYYIYATDGVNPAHSPASGYETDPYAVSIVPRPVKPFPVMLNNATAVSEGSLTLSWTMSGDLNFSHYRIYQSAQKGITGTAVATITERSATSYTLTGLSQNTTYYFVIRNHDNQSQYADSNQIAVTTTLPSPSDTPAAAQIIIVVAIVAAALLVVLIVRKRNRSL